MNSGNSDSLDMTIKEMTMRQFHSMPIILLLGAVLADGCGGDDLEQDLNGSIPEKYPTLPDDGPVDLSVPAEALLIGDQWVSVGPGEMVRYEFEKEAGYRYLIGLTRMSADLDLFSHWVPDVSRDNYQKVSWAYGTTDEQIEVTVKEDGKYYIGVHGYESGGQALLQLYRWMPADDAGDDDEVGWPMDWGNDQATLDELCGDPVTGGYRWLDDCSGSSCGGDRCRHPGLDLNTPGDLGMPVYAVADGEVAYATEYAGGWGGVVMLSHDLSSGLRFNSQYGHLDTVLVEAGDEVEKGTQIGTVGAPPGGGGPHLHFEIRTNVSIGATAYICRNAESTVVADYADPQEFIRTH